jgi:hypothetical protein
MRYALVAATGLLAAVFLFWSVDSSVPGVAAQPPAGLPEVSPKILALLKPVEIAEGDNELQKKLKERHNVAVNLLEARVNEYKRGVRDIGPVFEAARLTTEAKLDLAESAEARTAVLEQLLDVAKLIESHLQQQLARGFGSKADLEGARYARLTLEVELLRARQKANPKSD